MRVFVVPRQGIVAKTETKVHERRRDQDQRIPEGVPGECEFATGYHRRYVCIIFAIIIVIIMANQSIVLANL